MSYQCSSEKQHSLISKQGEEVPFRPGTQCVADRGEKPANVGEWAEWQDRDVPT